MTVRAKKQLGQHFLVDENILGVIGRLAELDEDDVVLEVGPGLGVLTTYLADRVAQVYAVELDSTLGPELTEHCQPLLEERPTPDVVEPQLLELTPHAFLRVAHPRSEDRAAP